MTLMPEQIYNLDKPTQRTSLMNVINAWTGMVRVSIKKAHRGRTLNQNGYYWAAILPAIRDGMEEMWGENLSVDEVHLFLRSRFLDKPVVNRETGEQMGSTAGSTAKLDVSEFVTYLDSCIKFAGEYLNVEVPEADGICV